MHLHRPRTTVIRIVLALAIAPVATLVGAADAHLAVHAKPGDMVLLRNVNTRPAYRPAPPGMALMADPSPRREVAGALGTGELSDADFASLDAATTHSPGHPAMVDRIVGSALAGPVGGGAAGGTAGTGTLVSGPIGNVGNVTRGIGGQVQGALAQLPGMLPAANGH